MNDKPSDLIIDHIHSPTIIDCSDIQDFIQTFKMK